jgi:hypothetical protein
MKILFAASSILLLVAAGAMAETTNNISDAEIQGIKLAQQIYWARPETNFTQTGVLKFRDSGHKETAIPFRFDFVVTATNWQTTYFAGSSVENAGGVLIVHTKGQPNVYFDDGGNNPPSPPSTPEKLPTTESVGPLAPGSDFWPCDLGLEFFHWPKQKVLKKEVHRSCGCTVLESTNPAPSTNSYSRVVSWIDTETLGIVEAYAYDAKGKLLKDFYPKDFKKVNGQWQVETLVMENVQTGSRSRLEFNLKK